MQVTLEEYRHDLTVTICATVPFAPSFLPSDCFLPFLSLPAASPDHIHARSSTLHDQAQLLLPQVAQQTLVSAHGADVSTSAAAQPVKPILD